MINWKWVPISLVLSASLSGCIDEYPILNREIVFGCYVGEGLPRIFINEVGINIDQSGMPTLDYEVKKGKEWMFIETGPYRLEIVNDKILFRRFNGSGAFWRILNNNEGMISHIRPLTNFGGEVYRRVEGGVCAGMSPREHAVTQVD